METSQPLPSSSLSLPPPALPPQPLYILPHCFTHCVLLQPYCLFYQSTFRQWFTMVLVVVYDNDKVLSFIRTITLINIKAIQNSKLSDNSFTIVLIIINYHVVSDNFLKGWELHFHAPIIYIPFC